MQSMNCIGYLDIGYLNKLLFVPGPLSTVRTRKYFIDNLTWTVMLSSTIH